MHHAWQFFDIRMDLCQHIVMFKTMIRSVLCLLLSICCLSCSTNHVTTIVVASDLHYLSDQLYDHGNAFLSVVGNADGKYMPFIEEITDTFVQEVISIHPDLVVLSGDLTFNGEKISHEMLCKKLSRIEESGIQVCIIPGNHDIENPYARKYEGDEVFFTGSISRNDFFRQYEMFGTDEALYRDNDSFSYVCQVNADTWMLMLDVNASSIDNALSQDTLAWMEEVLQESRRQGVDVISVTHQNLLQQSLFTDGFIISNAQSVIDLFEQYGVRLNLSGHIHIQHHTKKDSLMECTVSALPVSPLQYGVMTIQNHHVSYHSESLDVSKWARNSHREGYDDFSMYARQFFIDCGKNRKDEVKADEDLLDAYMQLNCAYFSGDLREVSMDEEIQNRWKETDPYTWVYIQTMLQEKGNDYRYFEVDLNE